MATSAATTISGLTTDASKTASSKTGLATDFNQFLTLLTTQLQNQDPLNPMDSNEFTNQLVQFSQVEQQINSNQKLDSLLALQLSSSISASLGYVGLDINYISSELSYDGQSTDNTITYSLEKGASSAKMSIVNEDGETIYSNDQIGKVAGKNTFTWDGKDSSGQLAPKGTYTVKIDALDADNAAVKSSIVVKGNVRGVETQDGTIYLLVGDRAVPVSNVLNAAQPATPTTTATTDTTSDTTDNSSDTPDTSA